MPKVNTVRTKLIKRYIWAHCLEEADHLHHTKEYQKINEQRKFHDLNLFLQT